MIKVAIIGFEYAFATAITGLVDLLSTAGTAWNYFRGEQITPRFKVQILSQNGALIRCLNNILIQAHGDFEQAFDAEIIILPSIGGDIEKTLEKNQAIVDLVATSYKRGAQIASNCTGAFFLAEAGLLDGRKATTHWAQAGLFRERYPNVNLVPEQLMTTDGRLFCSGGGHAWFDLGLHIVELYTDHQTAVESAKAMVMDMGRESQQRFLTLNALKYHNDERVQAIQHWVDEHFRDSFSLEWLASEFSMSTRTLIRRFKQATGESPLAYLQSVRLEAAKHHLENSNQSVAQITQDVGYEDVSSFSKLFKQKVGLTPREYRGRFSKTF